MLHAWSSCYALRLSNRYPTQTRRTILRSPAIPTAAQIAVPTLADKHNRNQLQQRRQLVVHNRRTPCIPRNHEVNKSSTLETHHVGGSDLHETSWAAVAHTRRRRKGAFSEWDSQRTRYESQSSPGDMRTPSHTHIAANPNPARTGALYAVDVEFHRPVLLTNYKSYRSS